MKKILSYILIAFVVVNLFAPLSVGINQNKITLEKNVANAEGIVLTTDVSKTNTSITVIVKAKWDKGWFVPFVTDSGILVTLSGGGLATPQSKEVKLEYDGTLNDTQEGSVIFSGLTPDTTFTVESTARQLDRLNYKWGILLADFSNLWTLKPEAIETGTKDGTFAEAKNTLTDKTLPTNQAGSVMSNRQVADSEVVDGMPDCGTGTLSFSLSGCIAQGLYYLIFMPTSFIFALAGNFFDFTFAYSVNDASYRSTFVVQGWGVVRDLCNMFFIFVLLYVAFKTILGLNVSKTKEMIINVIIIGIMINFSLFATQLIIDASNILARVFYNSNVIKIKISDNAGNGVTEKTTEVGPNGEIQLSAALVNKVNPQNLIINASQVGNIPDKGGQTSNDTPKGGVTTGTFILVTLLASAVNIIGLIVFISVGLIFVARVIGLWMAMIFAPLAFFSYAVPDMQNLSTIGLKHWWPETLKLAVLAPVFIFFLYLILKFLETGLGLPSANDTGGGISFVISIIIPFVFIMVLLWKAKDIAKTLSGTIGQTITGGVAAVGGLALGGAALGTALLGRQTLGAVSKYTQNDGARKNALSFKDTREAVGKIKGLNKFNPFAYLNVANKAVTGVGKATMAGIALAPANIGKKTDATGKTTNWFQREGKKAGEKTHAAHLLDEKAQAVSGSKDTKYKDLTEPEQQAVRDKIDKDIVAKEMFNKTYDKLDVGKGEKADVDTHKVLSGSWAASAEDVKRDAHSRGEHVHTATDLDKSRKADTAISEFITALRKGSYDVRNLSQIKTANAGITKMGIGLIAGVAAGVRTGIKSSGINHGSGQADFLSDIGHTITEAMKSAKVNVKIEESHGKSAEEAEKGGGHH